MNKKKKICLTTVASVILILVILGICLKRNRQEQDLSMFTGMVCEGMEYEQGEECGYLTVKNTTGRVMKIKVEDEELQKWLPHIDVSDIIGVDVDLRVPYKALDEKQIEENPDAVLEYIGTDNGLDVYLTLMNISMDDSE